MDEEKVVQQEPVVGEVPETQPKKKKGKGCLIGCLIVLILFIIGVVLLFSVLKTYLHFIVEFFQSIFGPEFLENLPILER